MRCGTGAWGSWAASVRVWHLMSWGMRPTDGGPRTGLSPPEGASVSYALRARADIVDQQDSKTLGYQFRLILNWDRDLL